MSAQDAPVGQPPAGLLAPEEVCDQFVAKCKEGAEKYLALTLPAERKHLNAELSAHFVSTILEGGMASQEAAAVAGLELLLLLTDTERLALGIDVVARAGAMAAVLQCLVEQKGSVRVPRLACQVIDVLGGRLKNRDEAANIGVCTNILQAMLPSALKDVEFVKASVSCLLSLTRHDPCSDQSVKSGAFGVLNTILNTKALYAVASLRTDVCRLVGHLILRSSDKNARIAADSGLIKTIAMMLDGASSDGQEGALSMLRELAPEPSVREVAIKAGMLDCVIRVIQSSNDREVTVRCLDTLCAFAGGAETAAKMVSKDVVECVLIYCIPPHIDDPSVQTRAAAMLRRLASYDKALKEDVVLRTRGGNAHVLLTQVLSKHIGDVTVVETVCELLATILDTENAQQQAAEAQIGVYVAAFAQGLHDNAHCQRAASHLLTVLAASRNHRAASAAAISAKAIFSQLTNFPDDPDTLAACFGALTGMLQSGSHETRDSVMKFGAPALLASAIGAAKKHLSDALVTGDALKLCKAVLLSIPESLPNAFELGLQQLCRLLIDKFDVFGKTMSQERMLVAAAELISMLSHSAAVDPQHLMDRGYDPNAPPGTSNGIRHNARAKSPLLGTSRARSPHGRSRSPLPGARTGTAGGRIGQLAGQPLRWSDTGPPLTAPDAASERLQRFQQHAPATRMNANNTGPPHARFANVPPPVPNSDRVFSLMALAGNRTFRLGRFEDSGAEKRESSDISEGPMPEGEAGAGAGSKIGLAIEERRSITEEEEGGSSGGAGTGASDREQSAGSSPQPPSPPSPASPSAHQRPPLHLNRITSKDKELAALAAAARPPPPAGAGAAPQAMSSAQQLGARRPANGPRAPPLIIPHPASAGPRSPGSALSPGTSASPSARQPLSPSVTSSPLTRSPQYAASPLSSLAEANEARRDRAAPAAGAASSAAAAAAAAAASGTSPTARRPVSSAPYAAGGSPPGRADPSAFASAAPLKPLGAGLIPGSNGSNRPGGTPAGGSERFAMRLPPVGGIRGNAAVGSLRGLALPGGAVSMVPAAAVRPIANYNRPAGR